MVSLTTDLVCVYMCVCMSTLTLVASLMALYILLSRFDETDRRSVKEETPGSDKGTLWHIVSTSALIDIPSFGPSRGEAYNPHVS